MNVSNNLIGIYENEVDVGLIIDRPVVDPEFIVERLSTEPMVFLAPPTHPLVNKKPVSPTDLSEECLIITEPGCSYRTCLKEMLDTWRVRPRSLLEVSSIESIKQFICG